MNPEAAAHNVRSAIQLRARAQALAQEEIQIFDKACELQLMAKHVAEVIMRPTLGIAAQQAGGAAGAGVQPLQPQQQLLQPRQSGGSVYVASGIQLAATPALQHIAQTGVQVVAPGTQPMAAAPASLADAAGASTAAPPTADAVAATTSDAGADLAAAAAEAARGDRMQQQQQQQLASSGPAAPQLPPLALAPPDLHVLQQQQQQLGQAGQPSLVLTAPTGLVQQQALLGPRPGLLQLVPPPAGVQVQLPAEGQTSLLQQLQAAAAGIVMPPASAP